MNRIALAVSIYTICVSAVSAEYTNGVFILNEDWFGHNESSMNFYNYETGEMEYRVFKAENSGEHLGNTSQFAQLFGDKLYIMSKQSYGSDASTGGRLIVADAKTLQQKASIADLDWKDGRAFVAVNDKVGYVGTSSGIYLFDMENYELGDMIEGTGSASGGLYSDQIGDMVRFRDHVYAAKQGDGLCVIDTKTHQLVTIVSIPNITTVFVTSAGELYAASTDANAEFVKINPTDFSTENIDVDSSDGAAYTWSSWGAWRSGSVAVDPKENCIYYYNQEYAKSILKYDFTSGVLTRDFAKLPEGDKYDQVMYGTGVSIDPVSRTIMLTATEEGWSTHFANNWMHFVDPETGEIIETVTLDSHYWFPAMAIYVDNYYPQFDMEPIALDATLGSVDIDLIGIASDVDNNNHLIVMSAEIANTNVCNIEQTAYGKYSLTAVTNGETELMVTADSNGHITTKSVPVTVSGVSSIVDIEFDENMPIEYFNLGVIRFQT